MDTLEQKRESLVELTGDLVGIRSSVGVVEHDEDALQKHIEEIRRTGRIDALPPVRVVPHYEREVLEYIEKQCRECGCRVEKRPVGGSGRYYLVAKKGERTSQAKFVQMFSGHVDTVWRDNNWKTNYKLERNGDKLSGVGAYDMKAGIAAMIDVMRTIDSDDVHKLQEGMTVMSTFLIGEEDNSDGADAFVRQNEDAAGVHLVVSPEIPSLDGRQETEANKPVIYARKGAVKTQALATRFTTAHEYESGQANANNVLARFITEIENEIERLGISHKVLGNEYLDARSLEGGKRLDAVKSAHAESLVVYHYVPSHTAEKVRTLIKKVRLRLAEERQIEKKGVNLSVSFDDTEYPPYIGNRTDPLSRMILSSAKDHFPDAGWDVGASVSDANIMYPSLNSQKLNVPYFEVGPVGGGEHSGYEWVSAESIVELTEYYKKLVFQYIPDYLAAQK